MEIKVCESEAQLQELSALASEIWHEYFPCIISEAQIDYMVERFQSYEAFVKAIKEDGYTYYLLYEDKLVGYLGVKCEEERVFLSKLYLHKNVRGKGYASLLLNQAITYAKEHDKKAIYLTCNKYNTNSLDIYAKKGFQTIDAVVNDIGNGFVMDDYILEYKL
ncbi:MAG: GNAT family N-acetyltransferase [Longicatena sp.]|nr:GNAT family N-acetyltransferase [Longicatena sp.]